jgi:hypothetical protein
MPEIRAIENLAAKLDELLIGWIEEAKSRIRGQS